MNSVIPPPIADRIATGAVTAKDKLEGQENATDGKGLPKDESVNSTLDTQSIADAVDKVNAHVKMVHRDLEFSVDDDSGKTVIKVIDSESKEVIRQIPPKELLAIARALTDDGQGSLLRVEA